jgi:hypothetical protein
MSRFGNPYAWFAAFTILTGLFLRSPALDVGLVADDWDHYAMSAGIYPAPRSPFGHFEFVRDAASDRDALLESGRLPWWSAPDLHMALFRRLSSALGYVDYAWLDGARHSTRMHLHSLAWWLLLVTGVACTLPLLLPLPAAALGTLLYALDDAHILKSVADASYVFLYARPQGFVQLELPAVGERMTLAPGAWPDPIAHANARP